MRRLAALLALLVLPMMTAAQAPDPTPPRDPQALAERYLFASPGGTAELTELPAPLDLGETTAELWVSRRGDALPTRITARLVQGGRVASYLPGVLIWAEDGVEIAPDEARAALQGMAGVFGQLVLRGNVQASSLGAADFVDPTDVLRVPDVDGDGFVHVLYSRGLSEDRTASQSPLDLLPAALAPGAFGNARELITLDTGPYAGIPASDPLYVNAAAGAFARMLLDENFPAQQPWLRNLLGLDLLDRISGATLAQESVDAYFNAPGTALQAMPGLVDGTAVSGGQSLFLRYLRQRFGEAIVYALFNASAGGLDALDEALAALGIVDPVTGGTPTAREVFADFAVANAVNGLFGDGRFTYTGTPPATGQTAVVTALEADVSYKADVAPFGAAYAAYTAPEAQLVRVSFRGATSAPRLPLPDGTPADQAYYWSGGAANTNPYMTRAVDLTGVREAELEFSAWWDVSYGWNYTLVSVSTDGGAHWEALRVGTGFNPHGAAYGPGLTGVSSAEAPRPFPVLGILLGQDGGTITRVSSGGPSELAGVRAGDVVLGAEGERFSGPPNVLALLAAYAPGDTLRLLVRRDGNELTIPVTLGAHPTRVRYPDPEWMTQRVSLDEYAGREILLRFERVSLPDRPDNGFALRDVAIPALDWADDGSGAGWTTEGWARVDNRVPPQWWLQVYTSGVPGQVSARLERPLTGQDSAWSALVPLAAGETVLVAASPMTEDTLQPAAFEVSVSPAS